LIYSIEYKGTRRTGGSIMGTAATRAKRKWNREHYTNVTVAMDPKLAARLKEHCKGQGASVTSVVTGLVAGYLKEETSSFKEGR
jgi:hypothetical protein